MKCFVLVSESQLAELQKISTELISQKDQLNLFMEEEDEDFLTKYWSVFCNLYILTFCMHS